MGGEDRGLHPRRRTGDKSPCAGVPFRGIASGAAIRETLCPPELGAAAFTTVPLGPKSYREGKAFFWDKLEARKARSRPTLAQPAAGEAEQGARQAARGRRLQGRSERQRIVPAGLREAGRPVGQRQGPGGELNPQPWLRRRGNQDGQLPTCFTYLSKFRHQIERYDPIAGAVDRQKTQRQQ